MLIECTKKLADAMKINVTPYDATHADSFYEWHANVFTFDRRKCVVLMNNKTRYSIVFYGMKMKEFKEFDVIALKAIKDTFLAEGFSEAVVDRYLERCGDVQYSKTHDRSIIGQLNDAIISISWKLEDFLPTEQVHMMDLSMWAGENLLCGPIGYAAPIDLLKKEFDSSF